MNEPLINNVAQLAGQSVEAAFRDMLGINLGSDEPKPLPADSSGQIVGSVGFIGEANGIIHLYTSQRFARLITAKMLGLTEAEVEGDDMINDAVGELSNVVVGRVKSNLCDGGRSCTLTVPSIMRGQQLSVGETSDTTNRVLGFRDSEHRLLVEVVVKKA